MWVSGCGYNWCHDPNFSAYRPEGAGGNIIMIIRSPAQITINNQIYYTKTNSVIVYRQRSPHIYAAHNAPFVNDWVRFQLNDEDWVFLDSIGIQFDTLMEYEDVYELSQLVKLISAENHSANKNSIESMSFLLRLLFLKLSDYANKKPVSFTHLTKKLTVLRNDIYSNPQQEWSIDSICKNLDISPSYLQHKYAQLFGNTIKDDIITSRLEYSKYLLTGTDHTVNKISHMVGYENDVHFMYIFKKKTGMTPSQYRNATATHS